MTARRILIVEDDTITRGFLVDALRMRGFSIETVSDGREAIELLAKREPDLVLTDVYMPNLNGVDLCRQMSAEHPDVPVVLMTGMSADSEEVMLWRSGARAFLRKPIRIQRLFDVIDAAFLSEGLDSAGDDEGAGGGGGGKETT